MHIHRAHTLNLAVKHSCLVLLAGLHKQRLKGPGCYLQALAQSLDLAARSDDAYFNKLVRIMATRCMTQAAYFGSGEVSPAEYYHYGLAAPLYTHFTSPIRR